MKKEDGFTLVEVTVAAAIFSIVSLLSFVVLRSSAESADLTEAKSLSQGNLRDTITALTAEVRPAFTERLAGTASADATAEPISVSGDGNSITFHVPDPSKGWGSHTVPGASAAITIAYENEDL